MESVDDSFCLNSICIANDYFHKTISKQRINLYCILHSSSNDKLFFTLLIICNIKNSVFKLTTLAKRLQTYVALPEKAYVDISWSYRKIFLIDIGAIIVILFLTIKFIRIYGNEAGFDAIVILANLWFFLGVKLITSAYIFGLYFAAQLIKKINKDLIRLMMNVQNTGKFNSKMLCKNNGVDLEYLSIMYKEVVKFAQEIHTTCSFNNTITIIFNSKDMVQSVS